MAYSDHRYPGPAVNFVAVTPSDSTALSSVRALYVGVTGNVAVRPVGGTAVTFVGVPAGAILPIAVDRVMATNTTATNIVALY